MRSKTLKLSITLGILLTVLLLSGTSFKTQLQDVAALEVNAHLNNLMKSSHSFLLTKPAPIAGGTLIERAKEGAFAKKNAAANDSLDAWFDRSQTQALIVQKKGRIVYQRYRTGAGDGRHVNAMSMTKAIIAILVGIAIDDGLINSESDSISQYLPQIVERAEFHGRDGGGDIAVGGDHDDPAIRAHVAECADNVQAITIGQAQIEYGELRADPAGDLDPVIDAFGLFHEEAAFLHRTDQPLAIGAVVIDDQQVLIVIAAICGAVSRCRLLLAAGHCPSSLVANVFSVSLYNYVGRRISKAFLGQ